VRSYPEPPEPAEGEEPVPISPEAEAARQLVEERQHQMRRLELSGAPILELEEGDDDQSGTEGDPEQPS